MPSTTSPSAQREIRETVGLPPSKPKKSPNVFRDYGLDRAGDRAGGDRHHADRERWVDFMMRFELGLEEPDPGAHALAP